MEVGIARFSFDYPYPVCTIGKWSVGGMEYPMITFKMAQRTELQDDGEARIL